MAAVSTSVQASGADPSAELDRALTALEELPAAIVQVATEEASTTILETVRARRGSLSVSGLGATLGLDSSTSSRGDTASGELTASPPGAWALVENGSRAHSLRPRSREAVTAPPHGVFARVNHPGTVGLHSWDAATDAARTASESVVADEVERRLPSG